MRLRTKSLVFSFLFIISGLQYKTLQAQIGHVGAIIETDDSEKTIPFIELKAARSLSSLAEAKNAGGKTSFKVGKFGELVPVDIHPEIEGRWFSGKSGVNVIRLGIYSKGASSLSPIFKNFHLVPGTKLFVYSPDRKNMHGAFTFRNNKETGVFSVSPITGDSLVLEFQIFGNGSSIGNCLISGVGIGYAKPDVLKSTDDEWYQKSAECEVDINCINENLVQKQKVSVVRIIYDGSSRCTGTLLNNTALDGKAFILTAGHCIKTASQASNAIYYFDYESPYCEGPDGELKSISGSTLLSRGNSNLDFSLLELSEIPPANYLPLYSGWDSRDMASNKSYIVHHPEGDVKKFSEDFDPKQVATFNEFDANSHWLIPDYEMGSTEDGSSGAPLFDESNRVIGSLSGGGVACSEFIYDYYQKFSDCWDRYSAASKQLKAWLDPANSGVEFLNSYQPHDPFLEYAAELSNVESSDSLGSMELNPGWGYISGHNSEGHDEYAEHYSVRGSKYIYAIEMDVSHAYAGKPDSRFEVVIRDLDDPNHEIVYEKEVYLFELIAEKTNLIRLDTSILVNHNFSVGYRIDYDFPVDTLAIATVLPESVKTNNTAYFREGNAWHPLSSAGEEITTALSIKLLVYDFALPESPEDIENYPQNLVTIYPNPAYDQLQILFKDKPEGTVSIKVYDTYGRLIRVFEAESPEPNIQLNTDFLSAGMFILHIEFSGGVEAVKLVKNKDW